MSKNVAVFVDVANLYYSARGQDVDVDYVALLKAATKGRDLIRAYAYSGLDPENENQRKFIDFLNKNGYKVLTKDIRKFGDGRVKANLDIELVVDLFRLADRMDIAVIISGDGDFAPAIRALQDKGVRCEVISFRPNTSSDLIAVADEFIDIMKIIGIGRGKKEGEKTDKVMSAPPMPAKEVVPEFGFREASPSVAAAALAALREGKEPRAATSGRGRGRGRTRAEPAATDEAAAPVAAVATDAVGAEGTAETTEGGEVRRRRRRRGGRGRGRGRARAHEAAAATPTEGTGEIGSVEVDDLSQLGDVGSMSDLGEPGEDREYTFEEADDATLAELGLLDNARAAEPKAAPRRRTRGGAAPKAAGTRTSDAAADADAAPSGDTDRPASRRRSRAAAAPKAATDSATAEAAAKPSAKPRGRSRAGAPKATGDASPAAEKPAARRPRSSPKAKDDAPEAGGEDAQGIWQRFRSARGQGRSS
ncbi:MAG TPA: NYN domain-containing protein [Candidatus Dormibacteraeota bacterium]|nr:NYN domain-containing protein [Candidatus Dormibacteraeota bacterium]